MWCAVEGHKIHVCVPHPQLVLRCVSHPQLVLRWNGIAHIAHDLTNSIRAKVMVSSHRTVIVKERLLGGPQFDYLQSL